MRIGSFAQTLPEGRRGTVLAVGLLLTGLFLAWFGLAAPLLGWYRTRADELVGQRRLAAHMQALAATLPTLRAEALGGRAALPPVALLSGTSDAVAAASLQGLIEEMARRTDARLASIAILPGEPAGTWRRIGLRLEVRGPFDVLVRLLRAVLRGAPVMMVDDLSLTGSALDAPGVPQTMDAEFTVYAFRRATPPGSSVDTREALAK